MNTMKRPVTPLQERLQEPDGHEVKTASEQRLSELAGQLRALTRAGLAPDQFSVAEKLTGMLEEARRVLKTQGCSPGPLAGSFLIPPQPTTKEH
jgi:hypothetical protein